MKIVELEKAVLVRSDSLFACDLDAEKDVLRESISGARILVIGAAGSIGGAFVQVLAGYHPAALWLVDPSENNLVEVVRDLRSSGTVLPKDFGTVAIGFGTREFEVFIRHQASFDYVLNFAALKHVRSERDPYSLMRLIGVNVLANEHLLDLLEGSGTKKVFSVSSDKAVNPHSLMGASKALMERVFLDRANRIPFSSARFANVAFSDGSLLHGFRYRIEKGQPLSAPSDIRRYFISHREAGELCLCSCFAGGNREVFVPRMDPDNYLMTFSEIAELVLKHFNLKPVLCSSEMEALEMAGQLRLGTKEWPCYFSESNTSGEKTFEEFVGNSEHVVEDRYKNLRVVDQPTTTSSEELQQALQRFKEIKELPNWSKVDMVEAMRLAIPELEHSELSANLDQKM